MQTTVNAKSVEGGLSLGVRRIIAYIVLVIITLKFFLASEYL